MHIVNLSKINSFGFEKYSLADGSVRLIKYVQLEGLDELVSFKPLYGNRYELSVNLPNDRIVDVVINIVKSSTNCYKITYSDCYKTLIPPVFNNYDEINNYLSSLYLHSSLE